MKFPLVSVIVTTFNNTSTIDACLNSIKQQTYSNIELVVVDNHSTDNTHEIAKRYADQLFVKGPERSTQRNFAASKSKGDYILIVDSDMVLTPKVVQACVEQLQQQPNVKAIIIPEESFGRGFWAQCKKLERSFYVGVTWIEAARFFDRKAFLHIGGYNEKLVSGEDWDLAQRLADTGETARINEFIMHNEGNLRLVRTLKKKYYYARKSGAQYIEVNRQTNGSALKAQGPLARYKLFFSQPAKLFKNPLYGTGMLFMKTCEFGYGAIGYLAAKRGETDE